MIRTSKFVGARLVEARTARGLSGAALAEILNLSPSAISQYENEHISPRSDAVELIADKLNMPPQFFFRSTLRHENRPVFWRSLSLASKGGRTQAQQRFRWFREIVRYIHGHLEFPSVDLPTVDLGDPTKISTEQIEAITDEVRLRWKLGEGPIADALLLLENHGVVVTRTSFGERGLDAFSYWSIADSLPYVVIGDDKGSACRERYDALHELGHLCLHWSLSDKAITAQKSHKLLELQAFRFASALALPARSFMSDLWAPTIDTFKSLKPRWKVSIGVMIHRCAELGVTTPEQTQRLWINYSRRGYRRDEPHDSEIPKEQPRLLRRCFDLLINSGVKSKADIVSDLALPANVIEGLSGLPAGYLNENFGSTVALGPRLRANVAGGSVVGFKRRPED